MTVALRRAFTPVRNPRRRMAAFLVVLVFAAGCTAASPNAAPPTPTASVAPPATFTDDTAGVQGTVLDDGLHPIGGAEVSLAQVSHTVLSDRDGTFSFSNVPPGTVTVTVTKPSYEPAVKTVSAPAGEITQLQFVLQSVAGEEPWHETVEVAGYVCFQVWALTMLSFSFLCPGEGRVFIPFDAHGNLSTIIAEMVWQKTSGVTSDEFQLAIWQGGSRSGVLDCEFCYGSKIGPSPLELRIDEGEGEAFVGVNGDGASAPVTLDNYVSTRASNNTPGGINVAFQQRVTIYDSMFYFEAAPSGFSALPDS